MSQKMSGGRGGWKQGEGGGGPAGAQCMRKSTIADARNSTVPNPCANVLAASIFFTSSMGSALPSVTWHANFCSSCGVLSQCSFSWLGSST